MLVNYHANMRDRDIPVAIGMAGLAAFYGGTCPDVPNSALLLHLRASSMLADINLKAAKELIGYCNSLSIDTDSLPVFDKYFKREKTNEFHTPSDWWIIDSFTETEVNAVNKIIPEVNIEEILNSRLSLLKDNQMDLLKLDFNQGRKI